MTTRRQNRARDLLSPSIHSSGRSSSSLTAELQTLQALNHTITSLTSSLSHVHSNLATLTSTVSNADSLLNTYTRLLNQTEFNNRLILDRQWAGTTDDLAQIEAENAAAAADQERKRRREAEAKAERERVAEEARRAEENRIASGATTRGRRGVVKGGRAGTTSANTAPHRRTVSVNAASTYQSAGTSSGLPSRAGYRAGSSLTTRGGTRGGSSSSGIPPPTYSRPSGLGGRGAPVGTSSGIARTGSQRVAGTSSASSSAIPTSRLYQPGSRGASTGGLGTTRGRGK